MGFWPLLKSFLTLKLCECYPKNLDLTGWTESLGLVEKAHLCIWPLWFSSQKLWPGSLPQIPASSCFLFSLFHSLSTFPANATCRFLILIDFPTYYSWFPWKSYFPGSYWALMPWPEFNSSCPSLTPLLLNLSLAFLIQTYRILC
jgi:hypothetical protein